MYQPLFPIIKPLVFNGKSGVLHVVHAYGDEARIYLKEGIIVQVETKRLTSNKAAATFSRWVNITTEFDEGNPGNYQPDPDIDTNTLLDFLEKAQKNITIISKNIPSDQIVYQIDSEKLHAAKKLTTEDFKMALLFDGKRTLKQVVTMTNKSELAVLTHTCKLILAGVASVAPTKNIMEKEDRIAFLSGLNQLLTDMVGPAGPVLVDDAFKAIGSHPYTLAAEEIADLLAEIGVMLDEEEKKKMMAWGERYQQTFDQA